MAEFEVVKAEALGEAYVRLAKAYGGVFHSYEVLACSGDGVEQLAILQDGKCVAGFNLQVIKLKGFRTIAAPKFHPHCGLFTVPIEGADSTILSKKKKIFSAISTYLKARKEPIISMAFPPDVTDMQPFIWNGFRTSVRYTYQLDLLQEGDVMSMYSSKTRNSIKKAIKLGVQIEKNPLEVDVLNQLNDNAAQQGFSYDQDALSRLVAVAKERHGLVYSATYNIQSVATAVSIADEHSAYYLFGGIDRKANIQGVLGYVLHAIIEDYQNKGLSIFDFEGSMIPAVENFFRGFGGKQVSYFMIAKAPMWLSPFLRLKGKKEF